MAIPRVFKYIGVGVTATLIDFAVYTLMMIIFNQTASLRPVAQMTAGIVSTISAYLMHSRITWKARDPGRRGVAMFFIWNALTILVIRNFLFGILGSWAGIYQFAYMLFSWIFSYEFVESTGVYILVTVITMTLNYLVYDKLVFSSDNSDKPEGDEQVNMQSVGKTGEKVQRKQKGKGKAA